MNFNFFNYDLLKKLIITYYRIKKIENTKRKNDIIAVIVGGKNYINSGNLFLRYASKNNISTFIIANRFFKKINNYKEALTNNHYISKEELLDTKKNKIELVENFIQNRFTKRIHGNFVAKETFEKVYGQNKDEITKKEFLEKFLNKNLIKNNNLDFKINLFALNAFSDAPRGSHQNSKFLFIDYYDAFIKTVETISIR